MSSTSPRSREQLLAQELLSPSAHRELPDYCADLSDGLRAALRLALYGAPVTDEILATTKEGLQSDF